MRGFYVYTMYYLTDDIWFPPVDQATSEGLLAVGGDLSTERLLLAYKSGIFPWFDSRQPILWWSPDPRFVLFPEHLKVSKSMRRILNQTDLVVTVNKAFRAVIMQCAKVERSGQKGTWITNEMIAAYIRLHDLGYAKSIEVWRDSALVGGLYGIDLNNGVFCGESMFALENNASKVGFITFIRNSNYNLIDCQVYTGHLKRLGAEDISRAAFLEYL